MKTEKTPKDVLAKELKTYQRQRSSLIANADNLGQFALIQGDSVIGLYPSFEGALAAGYDKIGLEPFLIKEITDSEEEPKYFSRNLR